MLESVIHEVTQKGNEANRLAGEIPRLSSELPRVSTGTVQKHTLPVEATIGRASLSHLLQLSTAEFELLDYDIRVIRWTVLDAATAWDAALVQAYLPKQMREAMRRRGVKYEDGAANNDFYQPCYEVFQKGEFSDDARLVGLRYSKR